MKKAVLKFRTIILSDVHLGTPECKAREVNHFLKYTRSEKLILNGDIIDGWSLKRKSSYWQNEHTRFVRLVLKKMEKQNTEVIYLSGNHDEVLRRFLPFSMDKLSFVDDYVLNAVKGRYLVIHGDAFDHVTQNHRWVSILGDIGYQLMLKINRFYNLYRSWRGKEYYSLSKAIKARVKEAVNYVSRFEDCVVEMARNHGCQGFICGHIHTPDDKMIGDVHYLNSGDWVESLTALVEHDDGRFEILTYEEFCQRLHREALRKSAEKGRPYDDGIEDYEPLILEDDPEFRESAMATSAVGDALDETGVVSSRN